MLSVVRAPATTADMDDIINAATKVLDNRHEFQAANA
jgi:hypothetical protein